ncbi:hypothetical protein J6590_101766 [Homalodisca vitripennis]|nr:hypothetical protein J6590_101766 [Homalodisca vitripennis]
MKIIGREGFSGCEPHVPGEPSRIGGVTIPSILALNGDGALIATTEPPCNRPDIPIHTISRDLRLVMCRSWISERKVCGNIVTFRSAIMFRHERCSALREFFPNCSEATANSVIDACDVS